MARLLPPESASVELVSRELQVGIAILEHWRSEALSPPLSSGVWIRLCSVMVTRLSLVITLSVVPTSSRSEVSEKA